MKKRNLNIELLRIISIIMIVISHYTVHKGIPNSSLPLGINRFFLEIFTLGNIGTIIFVLITGYYLSQKKEFNLNKLIKLYFQIFFYSIVIYLLLVVLKLEPFSIKNLLKALLPITSNQYWFATVYIILYLFYPFLNKFLNSINRQEHLEFLILNFLIFSLLSTITNTYYYSNELIQFIFFYAIGAYLSKYKDNIFKNNKINLIMLLSTSIILISSVIVFDLFTKIDSTYLFSRNSLFTILLAISLFNLFINRKKDVKFKKIISLIASLVFGVYLISDNKYLRPIIWNNIFHTKDYVNSNMLLVHFFISIVLVIGGALIIEYFRKLSIDNLYSKYLAKYVNKLEIKIRALFKHKFNAFK